MKHLILIVSIAFLFSCDHSESSSLQWIRSDVDNTYVDVFYITSTDVFHSYLPDSTESYTAVLSDEEVRSMTSEDLYIRDNIFGDSLNFFAPVYHQFTMAALMDKSPEEFAYIYNNVAKEICAAFDDYMANMNGGRRFILAGFSQGAMYIRDLLNHMTDEQYSRMVAAYMLGFGLSLKECQSEHIVPATDRLSSGVTISFNSVSNTSAIWNVVQNDACTCINPLNWKNDNTPCRFFYGGDSLTVVIDSSKNVLLVSGFDEGKHPLSFEAPWPKGNLHHFEIQFYNEAIHRNALDRAYRSQ